MLFAGFVGPQKGVPDLLEALRDTKLDSSEIQLTVMGDGDLIDMREFANSIGIDDMVTFTGRVSEQEKTKLIN